MTLKKMLIELLSVKQLREQCTAYDIEVDRWFTDAMRDGIARAKRAKPGPKIELMTVDQMRSALEAYGQTIAGNRTELVARLLEACCRYTTTSASEPLQLRERVLFQCIGFLHRFWMVPTYSLTNMWSTLRTAPSWFWASIHTLTGHWRSCSMLWKLFMSLALAGKLRC